jgi:hypothetical protein
MDAREPREDKTTALLRAAVLAAPGDTISLEQLLRPLRRRAFGFVLLLLAIPNFIPVPLGIGGIMGALVIALGLEMLVGLPRPWIPKFLKRRTISRSRLLGFLDRIDPISRRMEKACKPRLQRLTQRPWTIASGIVMVLVGILLALPIPFTNYVFGGVLIAFAMALVERDGALLLAVWAGTIATVVLSATFSGALLRLVRDLW